jgi:uncharacterized FlgJ-related protein
MTSLSSKPKLEPIKFDAIKQPSSVDNLNQQEAYDKFRNARIDGLKIVSIEPTTVTPNAHIVAFYKWIKVFIPIEQ